MGNIMSKFLKFSLVSVLAIGTFSIAPTFAQEGGDVEEVIVTGSKIKKVDIFDSSKPLEVVDAAQIERTGLNTLHRLLTFLTYLNDVEHGGSIYFKNYELDIQPKKGLTLIWPAEWTHTHKINEAKSGTKYIITGSLIFSK